MKAKELRIGNWVNNGEQLDYVIDTSSMMDLMNEAQVNEGLTGLKPIPLTEEWLLKFGFEYSDLNGDSGLWKIPPFQIYGKYNQFIYDYRLDVNYVHQLQNLYFALTGEELEIKEK
jgi:hypothetical protein